MSRISASYYRLSVSRTVRIAGGDSGNGVGYPSEQYSDMAAKWELVEDLLAGTDAMRAKGERWLPREQHESVSNYRTRLARSFLYNGLRDTIEKLTAKPFSRPVNVKPESLGSDQLDEIADDVDRAGMNITQFGRRLFEWAVSFGKAHVLVDYPVVEEGLNLAQEREADARPILLAVDPRDVIGWRSERDPGGKERLMQVRIKEKRWVADKAYGTKCIEYVRVINAPPTVAQNAEQPAAEDAQPATGTWELWELKDGRTYEKIKSGTHTFPGVPLVTVYFKRDQFMTAEPPMQDLAEMNLCHWQSSSDQRNILRFSRFGMWKATGMSQEEVEKPLTVGPSFSFKSVNPDADFAYVEPQGAAVKLGEEDLRRIEQRMETLGMQPLVQTTADSTAAGKRIDESKTETTIQAWVRATEEAIEEAYEMAAEWLGVELPEDFAVDIFSDFGISANGTADLEFLLKARTSGDLTRVTFLREIKRRGVLADNVDPEQEADEADAQASSFGGQELLPGEDPNQPPDPNADPEADPSADPTQEGNKPPPFPPRK